MKLNDFREGLEILEPYYENPNGYHLGAEHDQIYVYATDKRLPEAAVNRMVEMGWFQPDIDTGDEEFSAKHYIPEEGWSAFV